ncbi:MAG: S49 family peptidase [Nannocystaceae bacterium]
MASTASASRRTSARAATIACTGRGGSRPSASTSRSCATRPAWWPCSSGSNGPAAPASAACWWCTRPTRVAGPRCTSCARPSSASATRAATCSPTSRAHRCRRTTSRARPRRSTSTPRVRLDTWSLAFTQLYFRDVLAKLGVRAEVAHIAEYKSAGEAFSEQGPTAPDREQKDALLAATWDQVLGDIARARSLPRSTVRQLLDGAPHAPKDAVEAKLVDEVVFRDQLLPRISDALGTEVELRRFDDTAHETPSWAGQPYVAVVLVEGTIIDGESRTIPLVGVQFVGGDTIARTLRELRDDPACEGIVLRVNSGGGSALASDVMWREVELTAKAHARAPKFEPPIVVSMGDVAGSGGYYVAMGTDTVFADPLTITGSIGVISIHPDVSGLMGKLGVDAVTLSPGKNLDPSPPWRPWSDDQRACIERSIATTYDLFRTRVADARGLKPERVHELGRGHIYDGRKAQTLDLVDTLGGLHEAIAAVRAKAGVPRRTQLAIRVLPERRSLVELLLGALGREREPDERGARVRTRRDRRMQAHRPAPSLLPVGLDLPQVRAAISLLFLEPGQAQALMPWAP